MTGAIASAPSIAARAPARATGTTSAAAASSATSDQRDRSVHVRAISAVVGSVSSRVSFAGQLGQPVAQDEALAEARGGDRRAPGLGHRRGEQPALVADGLERLERAPARELAVGAREQVDAVARLGERDRRGRALHGAEAPAEQVARRRRRRVDRAARAA